MYGFDPEDGKKVGAICGYCGQEWLVPVHRRRPYELDTIDCGVCGAGICEACEQVKCEGAGCRRVMHKPCAVVVSEMCFCVKCAAEYTWQNREEEVSADRPRLR